jgi:hypothetical protein
MVGPLNLQVDELLENLVMAISARVLHRIHSKALWLRISLT